MNTSGWLQLGLYVVVLLLLAKPLGAYMAAVYEGRATRAQRIGGPLERLIYRGAGVDPERDMGWIEYSLAMLWFSLLGGLFVYALQRRPAMAAAQSADHGRGLAGLGVQHRGQLHHQHQLAGLRRRGHDELPDPDAGARGAEFRLGGDRHGGAGRADSRLRPQGSERHRQLLDRPRPLHGLHPAAAVDRVGGRPGQPGRRADVRQGRHGHAGAARRPTTIRRTARTGSRSRTTRAIRSPKRRPRPSRRFRSGPPRRRSRSSSSAPTAAASTTSIRRIRWKTRRRCPISWRCSRSC